MQLRGDWVLARPVIEDKTSGGVFLTDNMKQASMIADVLAVGPGRRREEKYVDKSDLEGGEEAIVRTRIQIVPMTVKPGDRIVMPLWSGYPIEHEEEELILLREQNCLAVIREGEEQDDGH